MRHFRCAACGAHNRIGEAPGGTAPVCGRCQAPLDVSGSPQAVNGEELERAIAGSPIPVLVDFWAPWCGPCRAAAPMLEEIGHARAGEVLVLKLDTQENPGGSGARGIRSIPTFVLHRGGTEIGRRVGLQPRAELEQWLDAALGRRA